MKYRISISLDEETVMLISRRLREKRDIFRNKSHLVEHAIRKALEDKDEQ